MKGGLMERVGVFYATREGHTARIAEHVASSLRRFGISVEVSNIRHAEPDLAGYSAVILAASVHAGTHEREMVAFVRRHIAQLGRVPAAFISVTLSQAGVEMPNATPEQRAQAAADVQKVLDRFYTDTGWRPKHVKAAAGALLYRQYNFFIRFIMKRISKKAGGSTDTSRDHIYTNWAELDRFTEKLAATFGLESKVEA
jgi:menaquinone-dependent protoporphyrinogen oxidase